jgi:hypothetical protein
MRIARLMLLWSLILPSGAHATEAYDGVLTFSLENDTLTGSDNNYTNGIGFTWTTANVANYDADSFVAKWTGFWDFLPLVGRNGTRTYASWTVGQEMNTPDDIEDPTPPEDDQPYSGVLYLDSALYSRHDRWGHAWHLRLGVVGPASQADDVQEQFHEMIGDDKPRGWDYQLPNEAIVNVGFTTARLLKEGSGESAFSWKLVGLGDTGLGNYFTGVGLGLYGEVGWNLVDTLGRTDLRGGLNAVSTVDVGPVEGWSVAFFAGTGGYGVVHYLPLDGTVFHDSRSVDSEPFVGMGSFGLALRHGRFVLDFARTYYTDTFETELEGAEFGTLSVSWYF